MVVKSGLCYVTLNRNLCCGDFPWGTREWGLLSCFLLSTCQAGSLQVKAKSELGTNSVEFGALFSTRPFQPTLGPQFLRSSFVSLVVADSSEDTFSDVSHTQGSWHRCWRARQGRRRGKGTQEPLPDSQTLPSHCLAERNECRAGVESPFWLHH